MFQEWCFVSGWFLKKPGVMRVGHRHTELDGNVDAALQKTHSELAALSKAKTLRPLAESSSFLPRLEMPFLRSANLLALRFSWARARASFDWAARPSPSLQSERESRLPLGAGGGDLFLAGALERVRSEGPLDLTGALGDMERVLGTKPGIKEPTGGG